MKRNKPMNRGTNGMKRTGFQRPRREVEKYQPERERPLSRIDRLEGVDIDRVHLQPRPARMVPVLTDIVSAPRPKEAPVRSEAYRRLVASLPCIVCGIAGYTQACHADLGKGMGIKTSDLTCWPGCGPHGGLPGCHYTLGTSGTMSRDERRAKEAAYAERTRCELVAQASLDRRVAAVLESVGILRPHSFSTPEPAGYQAGTP
jgi:hypothetical protein